MSIPISITSLAAKTPTRVVTHSPRDRLVLESSIETFIAIELQIFSTLLLAPCAVELVGSQIIYLGLCKLATQTTSSGLGAPRRRMRRERAQGHENFAIFLHPPHSKKLTRGNRLIAAEGVCWRKTNDLRSTTVIVSEIAKVSSGAAAKLWPKYQNIVADVCSCRGTDDDTGSDGFLPVLIVPFHGG